MRLAEVKPGMKVRYHPVIGGPHDGRVYIVTPSGPTKLPGMGEVCWLLRKPGCVSLEALSPVTDEDDAPAIEAGEKTEDEA
jgi:hypothetical protein